MKVHLVALVLIVCAVLACTVSGGKTKKQQRSDPAADADKYDRNYDQFVKTHFGGGDDQHLDKTAEYKLARQEADNGDYDDSSDDKSDDKSDDEEGDDEDDDEEPRRPVKKQKKNDDHDWYYEGKDDYERIKALSEKQVEELVKKPGNCKHYEKDGMVCATCEDPETGDNSESCAYSSKPHDKKVAYLSKKSHNYKKPQPVEVEDPESQDDEETEEQEEAAVNPPPSGPKPVKHKTESEDADYGAYKLAGHHDDVEDYDEPKFANLKVEPRSNLAIHDPKDFEIIPEKNFKQRNLNQAYTDFATKDWSKCNKLMKGDMTCYYCKDHKNAVQEECMFISESNPKNYKVERHETQAYDNSKKPTSRGMRITTTKQPIVVTPTSRFEAIRAGPARDEKKEKFSRIRMSRPLMPTKASIKSTAEPLVTPVYNLNPISHDDFINTANKKTIKRTISFRKKVFDNDHYMPSESRAIHFESHVRHTEK